MSSDLGEFLTVSGVVTGGILALFAFICGIMWAGNTWTCGQVGDAMGVDSQLAGLEICLVNDPDYGWVTLEERELSRTAERGLDAR